MGPSLERYGAAWAAEEVHEGVVDCGGVGALKWFRSISIGLEGLHNNLMMTIIPGSLSALLRI